MKATHPAPARGIREHRNDVIEWLAPVSSEEDPERWASAFSSYLAASSRKLDEVDTWLEPEYRPQAKKAKRGKKTKGPWPWSK